MTERKSDYILTSSPLAHRNDPDASHVAAASVDPGKSELVKQAIRELLAEAPRAAFQLQQAYFELRFMNGWPDVQLHSVSRRLSELHNEGVVRPVVDGDGNQVRVGSPAGATATVWELTEEQS